MNIEVYKMTTTGSSVSVQSFVHKSYQLMYHNDKKV